MLFDLVKFLGGRFLLATGCSSFIFERVAGGAIGAHEASELIGFFIQVATLIVSSLLLFLLSLFLILDVRLLIRSDFDEGRAIASKPDDEESLLNATHSLFSFFKTILICILKTLTPSSSLCFLLETLN